MRYFLKQDNWGCIINQHLIFEQHTPILWDEPLLSMSDYVNG